MCMWESEEAYGTSNDFGILRLATQLAETVLQVGVVDGHYHLFFISSL